MNAIDMAAVQVLALGSPHGDDRVAWDVADRLGCDCQMSAELHKLTSPWDLIEYLHPGSRIVILDACRSGAPVGTLSQRDERELTEFRDCDGSTHNGSISESLRLAHALKRHSDQLIVLAVEIDIPSTAEELSDAGRQAVVTMESETRRILLRWHALNPVAAGSQNQESLASGGPAQSKRV
jgi:hydrogenase maturation protease